MNQSNLDAVLELVSRVVGAFAQQFTENDDLLEQENSSLFAARQNSSVLLPDTEGLLLQQLPLRRQLPLEDGQVRTERQVRGSRGPQRAENFHLLSWLWLTR